MSRGIHFAALLLGGAIALGSLTLVNGTTYAEKAVSISAPKVDTAEPGGSAVAVFAGGCFWGMEAVFERVKGVSAVVSGYAGGTAATANYDAVSSEKTGHAEAIRIKQLGINWIDASAVPSMSAVHWPFSLGTMGVSRRVPPVGL